MQQVLNVYVLPKFAEAEELAGGIAVVIDVLRSTTTIVHALEAGAEEVIPCEEIDEARSVAGRFRPGRVVLGGERHGSKIAGFELGNSPEEYTPERVAGKTVVFTSTNGTRAMARARSARRTLLAAFVNASAVYARLLGEERIHILCSGTEGETSEDDMLLAGMLVERLQRLGGMAYQQNGEALAAQEYWLQSFPLSQALGAEPLPADMLAELLFDSVGARGLTALGLDDDILAAAQIDRFQGVPELDPKDFRIRLG